MYMSRVLLNPKLHQTMRALANPNVFHGAIEKAAAVQDPARETRVLWRTDRLHGNLYLILVSQKPLDLQILKDQFGYPEMPDEVRNLDCFLDSVKDESLWNFRLTCHPSRSSKKYVDQLGSSSHLYKTLKSHNRGLRYEVLKEKDQIEWLENTGKHNGFCINPRCLEITQSYRVTFSKKDPNEAKKRGRTVTFQSVTFEGVLMVTDPEKFRKTLCSGIGREKAYGQGLLTVIPCSSDAVRKEFEKPGSDDD